MSDIRRRIGGRHDAPARRACPVAQNAFEIASRKMTYGALSGTSSDGRVVLGLPEDERPVDLVVHEVERAPPALRVAPAVLLHHHLREVRAAPASRSTVPVGLSGEFRISSRAPGTCGRIWSGVGKKFDFAVDADRNPAGAGQVRVVVVVPRRHRVDRDVARLEERAVRAVEERPGAGRDHDGLDGVGEPELARVELHDLLAQRQDALGRRVVRLTRRRALPAWPRGARPGWETGASRSRRS